MRTIIDICGNQYAIPDELPNSFAGVKPINSPLISDIICIISTKSPHLLPKTFDESLQMWNIIQILGMQQYFPFILMVNSEIIEDNIITPKKYAITIIEDHSDNRNKSSKKALFSTIDSYIRFVFVDGVPLNHRVKDIYDDTFDAGEFNCAWKRTPDNSGSLWGNN